MGYYINPKGMSNEQWLERNGARIDASEVEALIGTPPTERQHLVPVCLVDNGWMKAAGIAYNDAEARLFLNDDGRPKQWYLVPQMKAKEWCHVLA